MSRVLVSSILATSILVASTPAYSASPPWTITTEYGVTDSVHSSPHKGIDFAIPEGTAISSLTPGVVDRIGDHGGKSFGKFVQVKSMNKTIIYAHLSETLVKEGDTISTGDVIAYSGNTGRSTGPHLHFQVNIQGKPADPMPTIWTATIKKALLGRDNHVQGEN